MSVVEASLGRTSSELVLWSVLVVLAGAVPGLGLIVGLLLAMTRLRDNRTARVVIPILGAAATAFWVLGLWGGFFGGSGVGPPTRV
jgi:hypothetical protein